MLFEDAIKIRNETGLDPTNNIELKERFYAISEPKFEKNDFLNYNELRGYLIKQVSDSYGGYPSTYHEPIKGNKISSIFSDYFGQWEFDFLDFIESIKNPKINPPEGKGYITFNVTNRFILRFVESKAPIAVASVKIAEFMNLKMNSLPIKIGNSFYRLYFSEEVKPPLFFDGNNASYEQKGKLTSFGELLLPITACQEIFMHKCEAAVKSFDDALEKARMTGQLDPYFSFPRSIFKLKLIDDKRIQLSQSSLQALIDSYVPFVKEKDSIRLTEQDERSKAILYILKNGLGGINIFEPYRGTIKLFIRVDKDIHELNKYDGLLAPRELSHNSGFKLRFCEKCNRTTPFRKCERCGSKTVEIYYCKKCEIYTKGETCPQCGSRTIEPHVAEINIKESLNYAAGRLKITNLREPKLPKALLSEPELPDKLLLRQKNSLLTSQFGMILTPIKLQAGNVNANEIEMPAKFEPLIKEIKSFINEELAIVYEKNLNYEEIGSHLILFNKPLNAGIELKIKGYRQGNEAIVNPNVIEFADLGVLDNQAYFALSEDVALNCICQKTKGIIIYKSSENADLIPIKLDYMRTPIYQQSLSEIIKGIINLLSIIYPDSANEIDSVNLIKKVENLFVRQSYICEKCGKRLRVPPLNMRCPRCGSKLAPRFTSSDLNNFILQLNQLSENFQGSQYKEIIDIYVNSIKSIFRASSQMSLGDFW